MKHRNCLGIRAPSVEGLVKLQIDRLNLVIESACSRRFCRMSLYLLVPPQNLIRDTFRAGKSLGLRERLSALGMEANFNQENTTIGGYTLA